MLYFATGNKDKFREVKMMLGDVEHLETDLPEIQSGDPKEIARSKLLEALKYKEGGVVVEDAAFHLHCLKGMPGPLIRWFLEALGPEGVYDIAERLGDNRAEARCIVGYADSKDRMRFFEGSVRGMVVPPRGKEGFGWDPIFLPDGSSRTYGEMSAAEKCKTSHRGIAFGKLAVYVARRGKGHI